MKRLFLIRGVPGSGKSYLAQLIANALAPIHALGTTFRELEQLTPFMVEADHFFTNPVTGVYKWNPKDLDKAHKWCHLCAVNSMVEGIQTVIVSNTFVKKKHMQPYTDVAKDLGYSVQILVCNGEFHNIHNVPQETVDKMRKEFEH